MGKEIGWKLAGRMRRNVHVRARGAPADERGAALAIALMVLIVLALLGSAAVMNSLIQVEIPNNEKQSKIAFYAAESGWQRGVHWFDKQYPAIMQEVTTQDIAADVIGDGTATRIAVTDDEEVSFSVDITYSGARMAPGYGLEFRKYMYTVDSTGRGHRSAEARVNVFVGKVFFVGAY